MRHYFISYESDTMDHIQQFENKDIALQVFDLMPARAGDRLYLLSGFEVEDLDINDYFTDVIAYK